MNEHFLKQPHRVGFLFIHGVANDKPGFSDFMMSEVAEELGEYGVFSSFREVCWYDVFQEQVDRLNDSLKHSKLSWTKARKFTVESVAQALSYEDKDGTGAYEAVQARIDEALAKLSADVGPNAPVVIVAHSLGTVIASNYIWDRQHGRKGGDSPLERLETLKALITMGSPLALYAGRWKGMGEPITMMTEGRIWLNLIASSDVLAWPLKNLNPRFNQEVTEDRVFKRGGLLGWAPTSHLRYWKSFHVAEKIVDMARFILD